MGKTELAPGPLPDGFEPMSDKHIAKNRRVAVAIGENNVRRYTWKRASEEQNARGWASSMTMTMESMVEHNDADMVAGFVNVAAAVLTYALDSLRFERARAEAAEQRAEVLAAELAQARAEGEAAGRAAERATVVAYLRAHPSVAERRGGQHVGVGPNPAVARFVLREAVPDIEAGEHIGAAGGAA